MPGLRRCKMNAHVVARQHAIAVEKQQIRRRLAATPSLRQRDKLKRGVRVRGEANVERRRARRTRRTICGVSSVEPSSVTTSSMRPSTPCCKAIDSSACANVRAAGRSTSSKAISGWLMVSEG